MREKRNDERVKGKMEGLLSEQLCLPALRGKYTEIRHCMWRLKKKMMKKNKKRTKNGHVRIINK